LVDRVTQSNGGTDRLPNSARVLAFPVALRQPQKGRKTRAFGHPAGVCNAPMTRQRLNQPDKNGQPPKQCSKMKKGRGAAPLFS
jgi:hypothetical protein